MNPSIPLAALLAISVHAKETEYHLTIAEQQVDITGKAVTAMTLNGGIPGPVLRFTEGDTAVIHVRNDLSESSSIHWHGMLLPSGMDGVPNLSVPPIEAGTTFTYRFKIRQTGTYWYHSHSGLQEQRGVYGAIVIAPKAKDHHADRDHVVVLGDWTNSNPGEILRNLRRGSEFFGIRKGNAQSVLGAAKTGKAGEFLSREAMRMPAMDLADVAYDAFIVNGRPEQHLAAKPGETVRLRIIDAAASTYFHLHYSGGPMTIVSADGQAVEPLRMDQPLLIGVAETYDVLVKVPARGAYEFRATAHDGSGHTSLWIGEGERHPAAALPQPFVYDTMMGFDLNHMMSGMAGVVRYEGFTPDPATQAVQAELYRKHDPLFFYGHADVLSNMTQGDLTLSTLLNIFSLEWKAGWDGVDGTEWEADLTYGRFINRFTTVFGGVYAEGVDGVRKEERLIGGIHYLLPGNFKSTAWIDSDGEARVSFERELMLTPRLAIFAEAEYDTREKWSYQAGAEYILTQYVSATALWDSHHGVGAGLTIRF